MTSKNSNLHNAKKQKADEFYTQLTDIEKELKYYREFFRDKIVYCNCDDPRESNFFRYFTMNFELLGLKKLIITAYKSDGHGVCYVYEGGGYNYNVVDDEYVTVTELNGTGDFRSDECIGFLKEADVVVTNPPFSLFREYVTLLMDYGKKFIIVGNMNAVTYKEIFPYIRDNKLWYGPSISSGDRAFYVPDDYELNASGCGVDENGRRFIRVKGVRWFTNVDDVKRERPLDLYKKYYGYEGEFPKFDNYDAVNVNKTCDIPYDYDGVMGVPITFLDKYCPGQFKILGMSASWDESDVMRNIKTSDAHRHGPIVNGKDIHHTQE